MITVGASVGSGSVTEECSDPHLTARLVSPLGRLLTTKQLIGWLLYSVRKVGVNKRSVFSLRGGLPAISLVSRNVPELLRDD